jgi:hypothetical protein
MKILKHLFMTKTKLLFLFSALIFITGCTKEEADFRDGGFEIPVIHGYHARDETGNSQGRYGYGIPNVKLGDDANFWDSRFFLTIFPNPIHNFLTVMMKTPDVNDVKKLWISRAIMRPPFEYGTILTDDKNNFIAGGSPLLQVEFTGDSAFLDLTALPNGYYRVYVEVNGEVFYDNLVVDRDYIPFR